MKTYVTILGFLFICINCSDILSPASEISLRRPERQSGNREDVLPESLAYYPHILTYTQDRYNTFARLWIQFARTYGMDTTIPSFDSVLLSPKLPIIGLSIDLFSNRNDTIPLSEITAHLFQFMYQWRELFNFDPFDLRIKRVKYDAGRYIFELEKYNYPDRPTVGWNTVTAIVSRKKGQLEEFISNCAPKLTMPLTARFGLAKAVRSVIGDTLVSYSSWGISRIIIITEDSIASAELAPLLVPQWSSHTGRMISIEYRYCWKLTVDDFNVYVDAITGKYLGYGEQSIVF